MWDRPNGGQTESNFMCRSVDHNFHLDGRCHCHFFPLCSFDLFDFYEMSTAIHAQWIAASMYSKYPHRAAATVASVTARNHIYLSISLNCVVRAENKNSIVVVVGLIFSCTLFVHSVNAWPSFLSLSLSAVDASIRSHTLPVRMH